MNHAEAMQRLIDDCVMESRIATARVLDHIHYDMDADLTGQLAKTSATWALIAYPELRD